jgi:hypothetical protein
MTTNSPFLNEGNEFFKSNALNEEGLLLKAKSFPAGTIRTYNGKKYKKGADGKWSSVKGEVKDKKETSEKENSKNKLGIKERIEKNAAFVALEDIKKEGGTKRFANPEAVAEKINRLTDSKVFADSESGTVKLKENKQKSKHVKTKSAKKALQLMDEDFSYGDAVKKVMKEDGISREQLDKELEPFI